MRIRDGNNLKWKHSPKRDLLNLNIDSILDSKIEGEWNVCNERSFSLKNHIQIDFLVEQMSLTEN